MDPQIHTLHIYRAWQTLDTIRNATSERTRN